MLQLPGLSEQEDSLLQAMRATLRDAIVEAGGALPFDRYMELALYAPGLGYYVNGRRKFGEAGDFVTAPEVSPLFSRCLAHQVGECLTRLGGGCVLEFGAGSGRMAADMLRELAALDRLPERYLILELSPSLQASQREILQATVPEFMSRIAWLSELPTEPLDAVLVANELLDAMPVHRFRATRDGWQEAFVAVDSDGFTDHWAVPQDEGLEPALRRIWPEGDTPAAGFSSEINLRLAPWLKAVDKVIGRGYLLLIDYGYPQREYYHAERTQGTLICHFRHRAHADPYLLPGLQDMTANVDFTAVARAAVASGFTLAGYTTQAHFLLDNGLGDMMSLSDPNNVQAHLRMAQGVKKLTLPTEMGERFKVMALARDAANELSGFRTRDLRNAL